MQLKLTAGKKAALTRKRRKIAKQAATTRKRRRTAKKAVATKKRLKIAALADAALRAVDDGKLDEARAALRAILDAT